jgi:DNA-binding CsgD family transcriptional regulator
VSSGLDAARRGILDQACDPSPGPWVADAVMTSLGRAVGFDGYCLFAVDPLTGLRAEMFSRHGLEASTERLVHNETVEHDENRYADLVIRRVHAGVLSSSDLRGSRSPRVNDILREEGRASELRLAIVSGGRYWGGLSLFRDERRVPFDDADAEAAHSLGDALAAAIARYHLRSGGDTAPPPPAGTVLLDESGRRVAVSEAAHAWLGGLAESWEDGATEEHVMRIVREVADAAAGRRPGPAVCRSRLPGGQWLVVSGSRVHLGDADVAVVLSPGDLASVVPVFGAWCRLTPRESGVLALLVRGLAAKQIARRLSLSQLTVNDHLRAVYRKAGVSGRDELLAAMT